MKAFRYLFFALLFAAGMPARAQFYGVNVTPMCWQVPGVGDSTIYAAFMSAAATTRPTRIHYFNVQGQAVNVTGGSLKWGYCDSPESDSLTIRLDSLIKLNFDIKLSLDSLQEPQLCNCTYILDLTGHSYSIASNSPYPTWSFNRVVTRNCGAGPEVVATIPGSIQASGNNRANNQYAPQNNYLQNGGYIDSFLVFTRNPTGSFWIYASPSLVALKYPNLVSQGLDTATLRFNSASPNTLKTALESVVSYAVNYKAITATPPLPFPTYSFQATVLNTGYFVLRFHTIHNPTGFYIGLNTNSGSRRVQYHVNDSTAVSITTGGYQGIILANTQTYNLPCDTTIQTVYSGTLVSGITDSSWYYNVLQSATPALAGSLGTGICQGPCPQSTECLSICDTVMVKVVSDLTNTTGTCQVQNIVEFPVTANNNSVNLAANTYHGITIAVTAGTVAITTKNGGIFLTQNFTAGQTFSVKAADCQLLATGFGINATSGTAIVSTIR